MASYNRAASRPILSELGAFQLGLHLAFHVRAMVITLTFLHSHRKVRYRAYIHMLKAFAPVAILLAAFAFRTKVGLWISEQQGTTKAKVTGVQREALCHRACDLGWYRSCVVRRSAILRCRIRYTGGPRVS
jgi:hypothetical protein